MREIDVSGVTQQMGAKSAKEVEDEGKVGWFNRCALHIYSDSCRVSNRQLSLSSPALPQILLLGHALRLLGPFDAPQLHVSKNDHVSPPTPTHHCTLNQSLVVRPRYT
jgi:hypothetical protein